MEIKSYGSVCIEGGDQVGKGDATSGLLKELESENINLTYSSFPIYATPIGASIRELLKNGCPEEILSSENNLETRIALFALNRLEFLDIYLSDEKFKDSLLVFDRSPFSNAVTIGYGASLMENFNEEEVMKYINMAMDYDSLMISMLGLDRCVVQLKSERRDWENMREKESDQYEKKDVQERCEEVYGMYKDIVGSGWNEVVTRDEKGWRDREEISDSIGRIIRDTYEDLVEIRNGLRFDIGFKEIVDRMYPKSVYGKKELSAYTTALKSNNKNDMYLNGVILGKQVADSCMNIRFSNSIVREEFRRIVFNVPEVMNVFKYFLGEKYVNKLKRALEL